MSDRPRTYPPKLPKGDEGRFRDLTAPIPRVALTRAEAAAALGMSLNTFERYVQPELPIIRLVPRSGSA